MAVGSSSITSGHGSGGASYGNLNNRLAHESTASPIDRNLVICLYVQTIDRGPFAIGSIWRVEGPAITGARQWADIIRSTYPARLIPAWGFEHPALTPMLKRLTRDDQAELRIGNVVG
jgi:hypothetical protein